MPQKSLRDDFFHKTKEVMKTKTGQRMPKTLLRFLMTKNNKSEKHKQIQAYYGFWILRPDLQWAMRCDGWRLPGSVGGHLGALSQSHATRNKIITQLH